MKKSVTRAQSATHRAKAAVEHAKPAGKKSPTAKEVAPVVAQTETAEAAIETAKVSTDTFVEESSVSAEKSPEQVATIPAVTEDPEKVEDIEDLVQEALEPAAEIYAANSETGACKMSSPYPKAPMRSFFRAKPLAPRKRSRLRRNPRWKLFRYKRPNHRYYHRIPKEPAVVLTS